MNSRVTLGLMGLLAVVLIAGGGLAGGALFDGPGLLLGLAAGFLVSGWLLRSYFGRGEPAVGGE